MAVDRLIAVLPSVSLGPVIRVDIFERQDGSFVVNEFESLDADIYSKGSQAKTGKIDSMTVQFLIEYYKQLLDSIVQQILNNK